MISRVLEKIRKSDFFNILFISATLILISKALQIDVGVNFQDEGFLWYGVKQTLNGYIPIQDFHSYDIGRYYWCAFWSYFFGSELIGLRISVSLFQFIGLCCGLYVIRKATSNWIFTLLAGVILSIWMFPRHKLFEISLSMAGIFFGFAILEYCNRKWILIGGIFVGVAALFGRNHGIYSFLALTILIFYALAKIRTRTNFNFFKEYSYFLVGIIIGYSPMLVMFVMIPDFFEIYLHKKIFIFFNGETKYFTLLPVQIPWFWTFDYSKYNFMKGIFNFIRGFLFFIIPIYYSTVFLLIFLKKSFFNIKIFHGLIASGVIGVFYMHHIFARAGLGHLAQGIFPFLIGLILLVYSFNKIFQSIAFILILFISLFSVGQRQPYYDKLFNKSKLIAYNINGDKLWIKKNEAKIISTFKKINDKYVKKGEELLIASNWSIIYPILDRRCPFYNSYILLPEDKQTQLKMIKDLDNKRVNWIILGDETFDGRDDLRFSKTHKIVFNYIRKNYDVVRIKGLPDSYNLYNKRS